MTYEVRTINRWRDLLAALAFVFPSLILLNLKVIPTEKDYSSVLILIALTIGGFAAFVIYRISRGRIKVDLTKEAFSLEVIKQPAFTKSRNINLSFKDVSWWRFSHAGSFIIMDKNTNKAIFHRDTNWSDTKDDFADFMHHLIQLIHIENKTRRELSIPPIQDKELEEWRSGAAKFNYYVFLIILIPLAILVFYKGDFRNPNTYFLLMGILGILSFVLKYWSLNKK